MVTVGGAGLLILRAHMRSKSLGSRDGKHWEDSKVGPDVMGKSESKEREGNSGLRSGKYVCVCCE